MPLGGARARFQPVYVADVADIVAEALTRGDAAGQVFEVAGPQVYTLGQLVEYVGDITGHRRPVVPLPEGLAMLQAGVLECLPGPLMSRDNVRSMRVDNLATGAPQPWGREPTSLETIAPAYLGSANKRARFAAWQLRRE